MKGVLLVNLGSPTSPDVKDVKKYLNQFLMDGNVIDIPVLIRLFLVRGIIVPRRAKYSAGLYQSIWTEEGSPLIVNTDKLAQKMRRQIELPLAISMRYGEPTVKDGLKELIDQGVNDVLVIPLYPQYAMSTTRTVMEEVERVKHKHFPQVKVSYLPAFFDKEEYVQALAGSIKHSLEGVTYDHILFSYHGIPERHLKKTDPTRSHCLMTEACCSTPSEAHKVCYRHQCIQTTELVARELGLEPGTYSNSYQSRLGKDPWMRPYTTDRIKAMPKEGVKNLAVVTPAFVSDCLETIEEIGSEAFEDFIQSGGESFTRIECLNAKDNWVKVLTNWVENPELFGEAY